MLLIIALAWSFVTIVRTAPQPEYVHESVTKQRSPFTPGTANGPKISELNCWPGLVALDKPVDSSPCPRRDAFIFPRAHSWQGYVGFSSTRGNPVAFSTVCSQYPGLACPKILCTYSQFARCSSCLQPATAATRTLEPRMDEFDGNVKGASTSKMTKKDQQNDQGGDSDCVQGSMSVPLPAAFCEFRSGKALATLTSKLSRRLGLICVRVKA
jgi:hypothetical protein